MLKHILIALCFLFTSCLIAQEESSLPPNPVLNPNDSIELPEFKGGNDKMYEFIEELSPYQVHSKAIDGNANSLIFSSFLVSKDGKLSDINILRSPNDELGNLLVSIFEKMPKWKPAKKNGKEIEKRVSVVVAFGDKK